MWKKLPKGLTHVDAVYERPDGKIAFFIGKNRFKLLRNRIEANLCVHNIIKFMSIL